jgi:small subunit ribosomal protein S19
MNRSLKKVPFFHHSLLKKIQKKQDNRTIKLWSRSSTIIPEFIGYSFEIHNGKNFVSIIVNDDMVGHKFGEFASTRKQVKHKVKKGKK